MPEILALYNTNLSNTAYNNNILSDPASLPLWIRPSTLSLVILTASLAVISEARFGVGQDLRLPSTH